MQIEESQVKEEACANSLARRSELSSILAQWQERYLQRVPIDGDLEYLGFWRENAFVQSGQELFSILPKHGQIIGEVMIPSFGAGKVKLGQTANVKVSNFPSDEYGILKGKVQSISRLSSRLRISNDETEAYQVLITFPEGPKTNFGQILPLDFESKGTVEQGARQISGIFLASPVLLGQIQSLDPFRLDIDRLAPLRLNLLRFNLRYQRQEYAF